MFARLPQQEDNVFRDMYVGITYVYFVGTPAPQLPKWRIDFDK